MAKQQRALTAQEALVAEFSAHSISTRSTFHPRQWRSGNEPADMIIAVGRSILMFNMTKSGSYLADLTEHNLDQARDRIAEWSTGKQIRGQNAYRSFEIDWDHIDHIAVISVVDGPHAACGAIDHTPWAMSDKVRIAGSVTTEFLFAFAQLGGGARDLISYINQRLGPTPTESAVATSKLRSHFDSRDIFYRDQFPIFKPEKTGRFSGREGEWMRQHKISMLTLRQNDSEDLEIFSDLSWEEVLPICRILSKNSSEMEFLAEGQIRMNILGLINKVMVVTSTNAEALAKLIPTLVEKSRADKCAFIYVFSINYHGCHGFIITEKNYHSWATDVEMRRIMASR